MPQASTYMIVHPGGDTAYAAHAGPASHIRVQITEREQVAEKVVSWFLGSMLLLLLLTLLFPRTGKRVRMLFYTRKAREVLDDKKTGYHQLLLQYLPYYRSLSPALQERFMKRTVTFMTTKQFEYVEIVPEERMPLLISAAAVQLTFGIEHYLLDYFEKIYVLHHDYHYGLNSMPFQGHVNHEGIYLSWNNFTRGFENYNDGDNVGLHEMAHALTYVNFNVTEGEDEGFRQRFIQFSQTGRWVFAQMQTEEAGGFLGNYAASRYEEFWAVCVEHFFERPVAFKIHLPELYAAMCELLNQDVLTPGIFLHPVEAVC